MRTKRLWSADEEINIRQIVQRIVVEGDLVLQTPAHFGNGDGDNLTDMPLLTDPLDGKSPLLTGASIAGALRSYLREREHGYGEPANKNSASVLLFGGLKGDDEGEQSPLIVEDTWGKSKSFGIEMRDGVRIRSDSRTAEADKLFNVQLWQAGTTFTLRFELLVRAKDDADELKQALETALQGFGDKDHDGEITLGARKRRGYGRVRANGWRVKTFDLTKKPDGLLDWLAHGHEPLATSAEILSAPSAMDARERFSIHATFALNGSLLIRGGGGKDDIGPDMVHLHSRHPNGKNSFSEQPILSGTSLTGALRARALKIARTIGADDMAMALIESMFGKTDTASRLRVEEHTVQIPIKQGVDRTQLVQNRVSIDRFTGGARETALFNEQPAFGGDDTTVTIDIHLVNPADDEQGLLLLLLKDLWTGDLPLGGESSVGRGRLKGKEATLTFKDGNQETTRTIKASGDDKVSVNASDRQVLEKCVEALKTHLRGGTDGKEE